MTSYSVIRQVRRGDPAPKPPAEDDTIPLGVVIAQDELRDFTVTVLMDVRQACSPPSKEFLNARAARFAKSAVKKNPLDRAVGEMSRLLFGASMLTPSPTTEQAI